MSKELVLRICGGNPGCIRVITQLLAGPNGESRVDKLEELRYRRSLIWLIYKDLLGNDLERMGTLLDNNQLGDEVERRIQNDENFARQWRRES
ncbi:MAG: hypothetical protein KAS54_03360 [Dehalococcoidia bacterium]|nr:hypothetical protein [Dehalococcoidia bacterium]